jgi:phosphate:Na+ symporter
MLVMSIFGGLGLFILGMVLLTENLKALASESLRHYIQRLTEKPLHGVVAGFVVTAVLQSSSASTLIVIGLVSSGLLSFRHALGVIYGANIGTTSTAWIVSLIGLKLNMSAIAMPMLAFGVMLKLLRPGKIAHYGLAMAGFALLFIGIDQMRFGMNEFSQTLAPDRYTLGGIGGRLLLMGLGVLMTIVMQSSSAAIAVTIAASAAGSISLEQAAAMVIGQNIGTTFTAIASSIGSNIYAKQTAIAHLLFNLVTGTFAFLLLPIFVKAMSWFATVTGSEGDAASIAAFQTAFNLFGLILFYPHSERFARWIERRIPVKPQDLTHRLDSKAIAGGSVALETIRLTVIDIGHALHQATQTLLFSSGDGRRDQLQIMEAQQALAQTYRHLRHNIPVESKDTQHYALRLRYLHVLDHLQRLSSLLLHLPAATPDAKAWVFSAEFRSAVRTSLQALADFFSQAHEGTLEHFRADELLESIKEQRKSVRVQLLNAIAENRLPPDDASLEIDRIKVLEDVVYHTLRAAYHLSMARQEAPQRAPLASELPESSL